MKSIYNIAILGFFAMTLLTSREAWAQKTGDIVRTENGRLIVVFDKRNTDQFAHMIQYFGMNADSLYNFSNIGAALKKDARFTRLSRCCQIRTQ